MRISCPTIRANMCCLSRSSRSVLTSSRSIAITTERARVCRRARRSNRVKATAIPHTMARATAQVRVGEEEVSRGGGRVKTGRRGRVVRRCRESRLREFCWAADFPETRLRWRRRGHCLLEIGRRTPAVEKSVQSGAGRCGLRGRREREKLRRARRAGQGRKRTEMLTVAVVPRKGTLRPCW